MKQALGDSARPLSLLDEFACAHDLASQQVLEIRYFFATGMKLENHDKLL